MYKYILKRLLMMIPVLLGVTFIVFFILNLSPGDPAAMILGDQASEEALEMKREELGLNDPLLVRYGRYVVNMVQGDLGTSYKNDLSVWDQVMERFPNTAVLAVAGILVALIIGIPTGIISAKKQYSAVDNVSMVLSLIGVSMPNFWFGLLVVIVFALNLGWLPSQGMGEGGVELLKSLVLPALTLGTGCAGNPYPYDPFVHVGGYSSGLHRYGESKGCIRAYHHLPSYAQKRSDSHRYGSRSAVWYTAWRRHADGDRILLAGTGTTDGRFH